MMAKNRPKWQFGRMNGPGGKVELVDIVYDGNGVVNEHKTLQCAMERETTEEIGQEIPYYRWSHIAKLEFIRDDEITELNVMTVVTDDDQIHSVTDENCFWYDVDHLIKVRHHPVAIDNIAWLICLCADDKSLPTLHGHYDLRTKEIPNG
jgi:hypothetical protein